MTTSNVWIWQDPDDKYIQDVIKYIEKEKNDLKRVVVIHASCSISDIRQTLVEYVLKLCQDLMLLENKRTTFLSYKDHLLAMELCISSVKHKKSGSEAEVTSKEILQCHTEYSKNISSEDVRGLDREYLVAYKEFLSYSNCTNIWHLGNMLQKERSNPSSAMHGMLEDIVFLVLGTFDSKASLQLGKLLSKGESVYRLFVESPLNASLEGSPGTKNNNDVNINISMETNSFNDISITATATNISATQEYTTDMILSFLCLLVNCRNELALSRAMTSPLINLSHLAFTDLKHASKEKDMPMCQTVISYITRLRLGGKGYAPSKDCPLYRHLKGLETFVDFINRLQTVIEEEPLSEMSVKRVISIIKNKLLKCDNDFRTSSIEDSAQYLIDSCLQILNHDCFVSLEQKPSHQCGQKAFDALYALVNYHAARHRCSDPEMILSHKPSQRTPLNLPPLLGYFRSPEEDSCSREESRSSTLTMEAIKIDALKDSESKSYFHSSDSNSVQKSCVNENTPNKVTFKDCLKENALRNIPRIPRAESKEAKCLNFGNNIKQTGTKRPALCDIKNQNKVKKANCAVTTKKKAPVKTKAQIKGQGNITSFFRKP